MKKTLLLASLAAFLFPLACGKPGGMFEKVKRKKGEGQRISHYVIHQPDVNFANDDVLVWKSPKREARAFKLPPGTKVEMIETVEGDPYDYQGVIYKIKTADGRTGWVPQKWVKAVLK